MKDLGEAAYIIESKIYHNRFKRLLELSQYTYIDKILKRFKMEDSKRGNLSTCHGIKLSNEQCPHTLSNT